MSEEIYDAARNVPQAIIWSILINGMLGFGLLLGTFLTLGDLEYYHPSYSHFCHPP